MTEESLFAYGFMQRALIAGILSGFACGMAGVFVVLLRVSFVGVCVSHAALAGALGGVFLGFSPLGGAFLCSLAAAAGIAPLAEKGSMSPDTATGVIFSVMLSLSMLALGLMPGARTEGLSLLWGSIVTVGWADIGLLCLVSFGVCAFVLLFYKELQTVLCHREAARASGIADALFTQAMLLLLGAVVAAGMKTVGGLLIYSLIITPAAAAYQITYNVGRMFLYSALFGVLSCWGGLAAAYYLEWPSGATIVFAAVIILVTALALSPKRRAAAKLGRRG